MLAIAPYYKDVTTYIGAGQSTENIAGTTVHHHLGEQYPGR